MKICPAFRKATLLLISTLFFSSASMAQSSAAINHFNEGSKRFNSGQYEQAISEANACLPELRPLKTVNIDAYNASTPGKVNKDFIFCVYKLLISSYDKLGKGQESKNSYAELVRLVGGLFQNNEAQIKKYLDETPLL